MSVSRDNMICYFKWVEGVSVSGHTYHATVGEAGCWNSVSQGLIAPRRRCLDHGAPVVPVLSSGDQPDVDGGSRIFLLV